MRNWHLLAVCGLLFAPVAHGSASEDLEQAWLTEAPPAQDDAARLAAIAKQRGRHARAPRRGEWTLQLAELELEQARALRVQAMVRAGAEREACRATPECDPAAVRSDRLPDREWYAEARSLCRSLVDSDPSDRASSCLATALEGAGEHREAIAAAEELIRRFPESPRVADAWLLLGQQRIEVYGDPYAALKAYLHASTYPRHPRYAQTLYVLASCLFEVGESDEALATLRTVVDRTPATDPLRGVALDTLVRSFADADELPQAIEYFRRIGRPDLADAMTERVAEIRRTQCGYPQPE